MAPMIAQIALLLAKASLYNFPTHVELVERIHAPERSAIE